MRLQLLRFASEAWKVCNDSPETWLSLYYLFLNLLRQNPTNTLLQDLTDLAYMRHMDYRAVHLRRF